MTAITTVSLVVVAVSLALVVRRYRSEIVAMEMKHDTEMRVASDTHTSIRSAQITKIGELEKEVERLSKLASSEVRFKLQSMSTSFVVSDFVVAHTPPEQLEQIIRGMIEDALQQMERRAREETCVIFTDPVISTFDSPLGKTYEVLVGTFPRFPPNSSYEIAGYRVHAEVEESDPRMVIVSFDAKRWFN